MVTRNREDTDRRIIRLRLTPAARAATTAFFERPATRWTTCWTTTTTSSWSRWNVS